MDYDTRAAVAAVCICDMEEAVDCDLEDWETWDIEAAESNTDEIMGVLEMVAELHWPDRGK